MMKNYGTTSAEEGSGHYSKRAWSVNGRSKDGLKI